MPTKTLIRSAEVMHLVAREAATFGVDVDGPVRFNMKQAVARKDAIVRTIQQNIYAGLARRRDAIAYLRGEARFLNEHEVDYGEGRLSFEKAIIATGARRVIPPIPGLDQVDYLHNRSALALDALPSSLIVIGGGYVGIEFAQMLARFGVQVTLLGRNPRLAKNEDPELTGLLADYLRKEGLAVFTNAPVTQVRQERGEKVVTALIDGQPREFRAQRLLVAAGRVGNTDTLGLEQAGVVTHGRGFVQVDEELRTSQPHIWALGDVKGGYMFTHVATYDGPIAALNAVKGLGKRVDYHAVPRVVYSSPTLAAVGLTEAQARAQGRNVVVGKSPAVRARSMAIGDTRGLLKAVVDADTRELLGFHILAAHADDLLHEAVTVMVDHGPVERISKAIHAHPTLSELVKAAAKAAR